MDPFRWRKMTWVLTICERRRDSMKVNHALTLAAAVAGVLAVAACGSSKPSAAPTVTVTTSVGSTTQAASTTETASTPATTTKPTPQETAGQKNARASAE